MQLPNTPPTCLHLIATTSKLPTTSSNLLQTIYNDLPTEYQQHTHPCTQHTNDLQNTHIPPPDTTPTPPNHHPLTTYHSRSSYHRHPVNDLQYLLCTNPRTTRQRRSNYHKPSTSDTRPTKKTKTYLPLAQQHANNSQNHGMVYVACRKCGEKTWLHGNGDRCQYVYNSDDSTRRLCSVGLTLSATHATAATFVVTLSRHACPRRHEAIVVEAPPTSAAPLPRSSSRCQRVGKN